MNNEWKIFGERLKASLNEREASYRWLADKTGITLTTICRYANSERVPRASEILKCAKALNVTCDYLLGLSNHPKCTRLNEPERKKGKWVVTSEFEDCRYAKCNQCKVTQVFYYNKPLTNFCPNCGADMREGESEIIRCKDCVHYSSHKDDYMCGINVLAYIHENDFCSRAERRTHKEVGE